MLVQTRSRIHSIDDSAFAPPLIQQVPISIEPVIGSNLVIEIIRTLAADLLDPLFESERGFGAASTIVARLMHFSIEAGDLANSDANAWFANHRGRVGKFLAATFYS